MGHQETQIGTNQELRHNKTEARYKNPTGSNKKRILKTCKLNKGWGTQGKHANQSR